MMRAALLTVALALTTGPALSEGAVTDHAELWDKHRAKADAKRAKQTNAEADDKRQAAQSAEAETGETAQATE